jgi:hypothetical protein
LTFLNQTRNTLLHYYHSSLPYTTLTPITESPSHSYTSHSPYPTHASLLHVPYAPSPPSSHTTHHHSHHPSSSALPHSSTASHISCPRGRPTVNPPQCPSQGTRRPRRARPRPPRETCRGPCAPCARCGDDDDGESLGRGCAVCDVAGAGTSRCRRRSRSRSRRMCGPRSVRVEAASGFV